jgi:arsenate reductase
MASIKADILDGIAQTIQSLDISVISNSRKNQLQPLMDFIRSKTSKNQPARLNFICTHNSRRSLMAQVWAQTFAHWFNIKNAFCYSGGTETTALFPIVAETLQNFGFKVQLLSKGENPVYSIKFSENEPSVIGFSKKYDDDFNPQSDFAAIMTCSQANGNCPFILGAEKRIPITFEDPKKYDGTLEELEKYKKTSLQIATELFYVFSSLKSK